MKIYGNPEPRAIEQLERCLAVEPGARGVLCADNHVGYSMPIGGVVGYRNYVSPSGVGFDIACGNMAVCTNVRAMDVSREERLRLADEIYKRISFGIGRVNDEPVEHPVIARIASSPIPMQRTLFQLAYQQLGTVGSGNHYVDILEEPSDPERPLWVGVHFGSRGFGHKTASMFMNVAQGREMDAPGGRDDMDAPPLLLDADSPSGQDYIEAMTIAGEYAYAGRELVVKKVLDIMGAKALATVHNHHNYTWREYHEGMWYWVVRKGATPAFPGQFGFVGGSMGDIAVILSGVDTPESRAALRSVMHGAGRVMSRRQAAGKTRVVSRWKCQNYRACSYSAAKGGYHKDDGGPTPTCPQCGHKLRLTPMREQLSKGAVDFEAVQTHLMEEDIILRGGGADEAPEVYRPLRDVLAAHNACVQIEHVLRPVIVVMAGGEVVDPYKD